MAYVGNRLSSLSAYALLAVVLTGLLNAALRLGDFSTLISTTYGRILAMKLFLVGLMARIGAFNQFVLGPKVLQSATTTVKGRHAIQQFFMALRIHIVVVLLILIAAAILIQGIPPAAMQGLPAMQQENMPGM